MRPYFGCGTSELSNTQETSEMPLGVTLHALHLAVLIGEMLNNHICVGQKLLIWADEQITLLS